MINIKPYVYSSLNSAWKSATLPAIVVGVMRLLNYSVNVSPVVAFSATTGAVTVAAASRYALWNPSAKVCQPVVE